MSGLNLIYIYVYKSDIKKLFVFLKKKYYVWIMLNNNIIYVFETRIVSRSLVSE